MCKESDDVKTKSVSSWFAVFDNPAEHGYIGTPEEVCERLRDEWIEGHPTRTGAWVYCISAKGLHHIHMVLEDADNMRFSHIKKTYAVGCHLEPTAGKKSQVEDYIYKRPPYDEKGERVLCCVVHGEIVGRQGRRTDIERIDEMIASGMKPKEILAQKFGFRRYEKMIRSACLDHRYREVPTIRDVKVHFLVGASGTGKSYTYRQLCEEYGEDEVCLITDYANGGFDRYEGEKILFLDEFKGELPYYVLLTVCDKYKATIHARFQNIWALWDQVYIASVYAPEDLYALMVPSHRRPRDTWAQMIRRLTDVTLYYIEEGVYRQYTIEANKYTTYAALKEEVTKK